MQQTRVEQGWEYYKKFISAFPDIHELANATDTNVFKLWEGLGYYTRCKNLIITAKHISKYLNGQFPDKYEEILKLKGIGPYTAAAIASFAFNLPYAVVDGNVFRVLSRYFGIPTPVDSAEGTKSFTLLAGNLLDKKQPGVYNQSLMDFGAVICKPQLPLCSICVLKSQCVAINNETVNSLPVKEKKIIKKTRWFYYFIIEHNGKLYVRKRSTKDIWQNLYEFVLIERNAPLPLENLHSHADIKALFGENGFAITHISPTCRQLLTHQKIIGQFIKISGKPLAEIGYDALTNKEISRLPFPKFITAYLKDKNVSLNLF